MRKVPQSKETADMVLTNGKVVTVDDAHPEAEAVAIKDGLVLAVGTSDEIAAHVSDATEVIDLEGRLAVPGFIEGHGHFMSLGNAKMILDLTTVNNWSEIVAMVGDAARDAEPGEWIRGRGWHQEKWDTLPSRRGRRHARSHRIERGLPPTTRCSSGTRAAMPGSRTPPRWSLPASTATHPIRRRHHRQKR